MSLSLESFVCFCVPSQVGTVFYPFIIVWCWINKCVDMIYLDHFLYFSRSFSTKTGVLALFCRWGTYSSKELNFPMPKHKWLIRIQIRGFLESRFFFLWQLLPPKHLFLSSPHLGGCCLLWSPELQSLPGASPSPTWHNSFRDLKLFNHAFACICACAMPACRGCSIAPLCPLRPSGCIVGQQALSQLSPLSCHFELMIKWCFFSKH